MTRVFLSSVAKGLADCREVAYGVIEGLVGYHCVRMEDFSAIDREVDKVCVEAVLSCHLAVFVLGPYYGTRERRTDRSFTEIEYNAAVLAQIPRLVFMTHHGFPVPADLIEDDLNRGAQNALRERANGERLVATFYDQHGLGTKIATAIRNWELGIRDDQNHRIG